MNNKERVLKAVEYINHHFDDDLSLEQLSGLVHLSKYHFHRLFTGVIGLSLHQYVRWQKLKRAANQLLFEKDRSILEIALAAGFESHEAFSRAFKARCGVTPREFRRTSSWLDWSSQPYMQIKKENEMMIPEIKDFPGARLAVIEHRGSPQTLPLSVDKLIGWARKQRLGKPLGGDVYMLAYDDPKKVAPREFRCDIGRVVPEEMTLGSGVVEKRLPQGRVAVATHSGSHDRLEETVYPLYRDWLPESSEELVDLPCVFCYQNFADEVAESALLTEVYLFLKN
ncbi:AraC family transcriptional regulator [Dongshaea marina]|uniref:AraC family transcriptional regulator n=1 Tax=Dongshaea marina TaxID=2047966 RepID=UPI000D3E51DD|nr:GyrI-like domain-containing protein [Dongshaea marina]